MKSFVSYSSQDIETARLLAEQLRKEDFIIMRDQDFLEGGQIFNTRLEQVLRSSDVVLLLLTNASRNSRWVNEEIVYALELGKRIIPLKLESNVDLPFGLKTVQYIDMSDRNRWLQGYQNLVGLLRGLDQGPSILPVKNTPQLAEQNSEPTLGTNPFIYGNRVPSNLFVGRERNLQTLIQRIGGADLQSISIVANRRMGKSSLLNYLEKEGARLFPAKYQWVFVYLDMTSARASSTENVMAAFLKSLKRQLSPEYHHLLWNESQNGERTDLEATMEDLRAEGIATVLLLDEWEEVQAHIDLNGFVNSLRSLGNSGTIAMVTSTTHELVDIYETTLDFMRRAGRDPNDTSTFHNIFKTLYLNTMPTNEWNELVRKAFTASQRELRTSDLKLIGELAGGHPYLTQLAGSIVWNSIDDGSSDAEIRREFMREAELIFTDLWHKVTVENQTRILRYILGLQKSDGLSQNQIDRAINQLRERGVLTASGEIFSASYADFIRSLSVTGI